MRHELRPIRVAPPSSSRSYILQHWFSKTLRNFSHLAFLEASSPILTTRQKVRPDHKRFDRSSEGDFESGGSIVPGFGVGFVVEVLRGVEGSNSENKSYCNCSKI
ncbi:unnamed protein product [Cochlearia groenlandica]